MTPERYRRIGEIFDAVLELPFEDRSACLKQASDGDASLLDEVEKLLANHPDSHTFLPLRENAHQASCEMSGLLPNLLRHAGAHRIFRRLIRRKK